MIPDDQLVAEATVAARYFHANSPDGGRRLAHVERTAALIPANHGPLCQAVALMHHTSADATGFPPVVTGAVQALRRRQSEDDLDYWRRIADNAIATCVFHAHLADNVARIDILHTRVQQAAFDAYADADNWFTQHVTGWAPVIIDVARMKATLDPKVTGFPHVAVMPAEVEAKIKAVVDRIASEACNEGGGLVTYDSWVREQIDEVLHLVSVQVREDLAGLADEQPLPNFAEDDYAGGYRHAMIDAQQLRSLS